MAETIVVTGASGFVGGALTAHLARSGFVVRALSRAGAGPEIPGVTPLQYELDATPPTAALDGAHAVIHAAFTDRDRAQGVDPNVTGALAVLAAARAAGAKPIFLSSFSAHPDALSSYGRSKLAIERLWNQPGEAIIRLGLVVGNGGVFARMRESARGRSLLPVPGAGKPVQLIGVDDACRAIEHVVRDDLAGTFRVATAGPVPMRALYRALAGPDARLVPVPLTPLYLAARAARRVGIALPFTTDNVAGLMRMRAQPVDEDLARLGIRPCALADVVASIERREADGHRPR
jgi:nucleoside-diphosphate-sugar epimerase